MRLAHKTYPSHWTGAFAALSAGIAAAAFLWLIGYFASGAPI